VDETPKGFLERIPAWSRDLEGRFWPRASVADMGPARKLSGDKRPHSLRLQGKSLAVYDLPVDGDRNMDAGTALCIGHPDRLRHGVGELSTMFKGLEPEPGTIHVGILRPLFGGQFF
jgi:hypothetical protein